MSKYIESCRTKPIQESFVMLVTYRYKFVALRKFVTFKYNFVTMIFCHNQKSNRVQKVSFCGTNQKYFFFIKILCQNKTKMKILKDYGGLLV